MEDKRREPRFAVTVEVVSPGLHLAVYAVGPDGGTGPRLGETPLRIDTIVVHKEMWKHGAMPPPPVRNTPALERAEPAGAGPTLATSGAPLGWSLLVESRPGGALRRIDFSLAPDELARVFRERRIRLLVPPGPDPAGGL